MGKRIISQARGKGSLSYRVRKKAYQFKIQYPQAIGSAKILKLIHSAGHSAPLMKLMAGKEIFYNPAFNGAVVGESITLAGEEVKFGNIIQLKFVPVGTQVYNIECNPGDGGKMIRTAGSSATVAKIYDNNKIGLLMPSKKEIVIPADCRATVGTIAGDQRLLKPFIGASAKFFKMKARNKLWPRTSAVKMNAVDHPFGSGRGKRIKPKIAKRNAPPGTRVGHIRPRQTGKRK